VTLSRLMARLLARAIRRSDGCLIVGTAESKQRYWCVNYDGKRRKAHQAAFEFYNGRPPREGLEVCHRCDNTRCIEETHVFEGTHAFNMADRDAKGRNGTLGEASPLAKLTAESVLLIYEQTQNGSDFYDIASRFNVSVVTVTRIAERKTWKHLLCPKELPRIACPERRKLTDRLSIWQPELLHLTPLPA